MRTKSAYVAILLALAAGTALTVVSCTPDTTAPRAVAAAAPMTTQAKVDDLRQKYDWIGKYHTDGLAYIYSKLSTSDGKVKTRADMCKLAAKALKEFHKATRGSDVPDALLGVSFQREECPSESEVASSRQIVLSFPAGASRRFDLSPEATGYIDRLGAVPESSTSQYEFLEQVNAIEFEAVATLPESEAAAVSAVASVARSSELYWEENLTSWSTMPGALPIPYSMEVSGGPEQLVYASLSGWWDHPAVSGFRKVLAADILSGGRTAYLAWALGPIVWEAVAASALFGSVVAAAALLF